MKIITALFLFLNIISCASSEKSAEKSAENSFKLRPYLEETLSNGLQVIYIKDDSLPRVSLQMMVKVGSVQDPKGLEGLSYLTGSLLESGTILRNSNKLADDFAFIGSDIQISVGSEMTNLAASALSSNKETLVKLFSEVILKPAYSIQEIQRKRSQTIAQIEKLPDNPSAYADFLLNQNLYGENPYSRLNAGTKEGLEQVTKSEIIKHYLKYYRPGNAILAVVGAWDDNFKEKIKKEFSSWQSRPLEQTNLSSIDNKNEKMFTVISKEGLKQVQIRMGHLAISRNHPDFLKLRIANLVLGGAFASRLNQKIRDDLGLTYSISSSLETLKTAGTFEISTFSRYEKTKEAIDQTRSVYQEFAKNGISKKELEAAKALLVGQFPGAIETADRLAYNLLVLRFYGINDSYLQDYIKNVSQISLNEVNEAIKANMNPKQLKVVIFADEKQLPQLN